MAPSGPPAAGAPGSLLAGPAPWFFAGMAAGFVVPGAAALVAPHVVAILVVLMTLALTDVPAAALAHAFTRRGARPLALHLVLNHGMLTAVTLLGALILVRDPDHLAGFVIMASVPTAIAIVPLTRLLGGDTAPVAASTLAAYLMAPIMTPAIVFLVLGDRVPLLPLVSTVAQLVAGPLLLSRLLHGIDGVPAAATAKRLAMNAGFGLLAYAIIGIDRENLLDAATWTGPVLPVALLRTGGALALTAAITAGIGWRQRLPALFAGSLKNLGLTASLALVVVGPAATVPAAVAFPMEYATILFLAVVAARRAGGPDGAPARSV